MRQAANSKTTLRSQYFTRNVPLNHLTGQCVRLAVLTGLYVQQRWFSLLWDEWWISRCWCSFHCDQLVREMVVRVIYLRFANKIISWFFGGFDSTSSMGSENAIFVSQGSRPCHSPLAVTVTFLDFSRIKVDWCFFLVNQCFVLFDHVTWLCHHTRVQQTVITRMFALVCAPS